MNEAQIGDERKIQERKTTEAAKALLLAKSNFAKEYIRYWHLVPACDDATGFRLLALFQQQVQLYVFNYKRGSDPGVQQAANEMYRLVLVDAATYTLTELNGFVKWYGRLKGRISKAIGDLYDYHGDSFGDLCDSLPLANKGVVSRCLATDTKKPNLNGFLNADEIPKAIETAMGDEWCKFICGGENYIASTLEQEAYKWYLHSLFHDEKRITQEEQRAADYAFHFDD